MDGQSYLARLHNLDERNQNSVKFKYFSEMSLTGNQDYNEMKAKRIKWKADVSLKLRGPTKPNYKNGFKK